MKIKFKCSPKYTYSMFCFHFSKWYIVIYYCCVQISDQVKSGFSPGLSLPQICENFLKAAYDPRISGVYLHIDSLDCGWGKVEEIRRHILNFKKSGKNTRAVLSCSLNVKIPFFILYDVDRNFYYSQASLC